MEEYLAMIKIFAGNFAPRGYALCQGQLVSIANNQALFALIGTTFGGDGRTTFGMPDLRGRMPVGTGQGPGLSSIQLGQMAGATNVTILNVQMPVHTHTAEVTVAPPVNGEVANTDSPEGAYLALAGSPLYNTGATPGQTAGSFAAQATISPAGGSQPVDISNPYLGVNYIICTEGIFPSRN